MAVMLSVVLSRSVLAAESGYTARTKAMYNAVCAVCHGKDGLGMTIGNNRFPVIAGLPRWYLENQLILYKHDGRGAHPQDKEGLMMHAMVRTLRTDKEIREMAAYIGNKLKEKKPYQPTVEGDIKNGKKIYENPATCIRCHGNDFKGKDVEVPGQGYFKAPPLTSLDDWYMLSQLKKFMEKHRGEPAQTVKGRKLKLSQQDINSPSFGPAQMQAMTMVAFPVEADREQAMRDVVAYIYRTSRQKTPVDKKQP
jgi:cytochrome c553